MCETVYCRRRVVSDHKLIYFQEGLNIDDGEKAKEAQKELEEAFKPLTTWLKENGEYGRRLLLVGEGRAKTVFAIVQ